MSQVLVRGRRVSVTAFTSMDHKYSFGQEIPLSIKFHLASASACSIDPHDFYPNTWKFCRGTPLWPNDLTELAYATSDVTDSTNEKLCDTEGK